MTEMHYFAYGSNLHPIRLQDRIPRARLKQIGYLSGFRLTWNMHGRDDSAKCNIQHTGDESDYCYGAVYTISTADKSVLDEYERRYYTREVEVLVDRQLQRCFTYVAEDAHLTDTLQPFCWYLDLVYHGGVFLGFPDHYIERLKSTPFQRDHDETRRQRHEELVAQIRR